MEEKQTGNGMVDRSNYQGSSYGEVHFGTDIVFVQTNDEGFIIGATERNRPLGDKKHWDAEL